MRIESGCFRQVLLLGPWAIKVPQTYSWKTFLRGMIANIDERRVWHKWPKSLQHRLCPIIYAGAFGLVVIMPRLQLLSEGELAYAFPTKSAFDKAIAVENWWIPVERKTDSWGWYKGFVVAIDYHELGE